MNLLLILQLAYFFIPPEIYETNFLSIDGQTVNMSSFKGKRILVASVDATEPKAEKFMFLDSIMQTQPGIQVIIVPAIKDGSIAVKERIKELSGATRSKIIIADPAGVSKKEGKEQQALFQWLTKKENNTHFDMDGGADQYFIISAEGTLYAVAEAGAPNSVLLNLLKINFDESQHLIYNPETHLYEPRKK